MVEEKGKKDKEEIHIEQLVTGFIPVWRCWYR